MTADTFFSSFPFDVAWNAKPLDYAERAYEACVDAAAEIQSQAMEFLNGRLAKDSAFIVRLGQCRTPLEILAAQADYAGRAFVDFVDEGQQILACCNAARERALGAAGQQPASARETTRAPRRPAHPAHSH